MVRISGNGFWAAQVLIDNSGALVKRHDQKARRIIGQH
jgi:hypothetical protein